MSHWKFCKLDSQLCIFFSFAIPIYASIFQDWTSAVLNNQHTKCGPLETKALECIEYYGKQRGYVICKDYYDDFIECNYQDLQVIVLEKQKKFF